MEGCKTINSGEIESPALIPKRLVFPSKVRVRASRGVTAENRTRVDFRKFAWTLISVGQCRLNTPNIKQLTCRIEIGLNSNDFNFHEKRET